MIENAPFFCSNGSPSRQETSGIIQPLGLGYPPILTDASLPSPVGALANLIPFDSPELVH